MACSRPLRLYQAFLLQLLMVVVLALIILNRIVAELFHIQSGCARCLRDDSPSICLPKATLLHQETRAVCENQLISCCQFVEHLKKCYAQNSEGLVRMPVCEKDGLKRLQMEDRVLFQWTDAATTVWFPFRGFSKSVRIRRKGPDYKAWSLLCVFSPDKSYIFNFCLPNAFNFIIF